MGRSRTFDAAQRVLHGLVVTCLFLGVVSIVLREMAGPLRIGSRGDYTRLGILSLLLGFILAIISFVAYRVGRRK